MTPRQTRLLKYHLDIAQLACTGENNVFWVLDLCDEDAFRVAEGFQSRETLIAARDKELSRNHIPASTLASSLALLNRYRTHILGLPALPAPPPQSIYVVVCTEGRVGCAAIPAFSNTPA